MEQCERATQNMWLAKGWPASNISRGLESRRAKRIRRCGTGAAESHDWHLGWWQVVKPPLLELITPYCTSVTYTVLHVGGPLEHVEPLEGCSQNFSSRTDRAADEQCSQRPVNNLRHLETRVTRQLRISKQLAAIYLSAC